MSSRILASAKAQMEAGEFYEAHQKLRTLANRYMNSVGVSQRGKGVSARNVEKTIELLCGGASTLLEYQQSTSAADLIAYVLDIYTQHRVLPINSARANDAEESTESTREDTSIKSYQTDRQRICDLLVKLPATEASLPGLISAFIKWSTKCRHVFWLREHPVSVPVPAGSTQPLPAYLAAGDPEIHHLVGTYLGGAGRYEAAEPHLLLGTEESARRMGEFASEAWESVQATQPTDPGLWTIRGVLQLLALHKPHAAYVFLEAFTKHLGSVSAGELLRGSRGDLLTQHRSNAPMLNFCQLLLFTVERQSEDVFLKLRREYPVEWAKSTPTVNKLLDIIGQLYFNIAVPRHTNPLQDIMSAFFGAGPSSSGALPSTPGHPPALD
ncbi:hypothetical protein IWQ61_001533 [Dispira simplex]|nr:hypothetical protein IWQ61_001533 [Dispira simplex]